MPTGVVPVPALFQQAGYYTCIGSWPPKNKGLGKTDYNFEYDKSIYNGNDWSGRAAGQPFFMQIQLAGGKNRHNAKWNEIAARELGTLTKSESVKLPPYYPRDEVLLADWAQYLDTVRYTDQQVGQVIQRLSADGLLTNTVVCFMTDHGISHARGKQFLYDEGTHVPLVIAGPGIQPAVRTDLVSHIDLTATSLALAGIEIPAAMQGRNLFAVNYRPRTEVISARDRCDETTDHIRSVRTDQFKYVRNFLPARPHLQPNRYKDNKAIVLRLRELHAAGQLDELTERLLFAPTRAPEELYDLATDPFETKNLAKDLDHRQVLTLMRDKLERWMEETKDLGQTPETDEQYDSDMAVYVGEDGGKNPKQREILLRNIEQMKAWARAGK